VYFDYNLVHTLGFVNANYDNTGALTGGIARPLGVPPVVPGDPLIAPAYVGEPNVPFPWITWNNRPYANPMELLQVPTSSPQNIDLEFMFAEATDTYNETVTAPFPAAQGFFRHLPNFFLTTQYDPTGGPPIEGADFYRLFDHVETPSPFAGTERWYLPTQTVAGNHGFGYRAPFNHLSRFRVPGRININTVVDPLVWDAITATYPDLQTGFSTAFFQLLQSRRGYRVEDPSGTSLDTDGTIDMFRGNPDYPSIVCNPIRPADSFDLQPLNLMKLLRPVDATLLRGTGTPLSASDPPPAMGYPYPSPVPLLNNNVYNIAAPGDPNYYRATDRNSYFRHLPYAKVSNMLSTTSNTFAVWITVGYFEVIPNTPIPNPINPPQPVSLGGVDVAHPDGFQLGAEMLFDGVVRRPRAFFLIDRSIPVAYEPGQAHNINKCVLQRRYLD
jgi:hypothetical protein